MKSVAIVNNSSQAKEDLKLSVTIGKRNYAARLGPGEGVFIDDETKQDAVFNVQVQVEDGNPKNAGVEPFRDAGGEAIAPAVFVRMGKHEYKLKGV